MRAPTNKIVLRVPNQTKYAELLIRIEIVFFCFLCRLKSGVVNVANFYQTAGSSSDAISSLAYILILALPLVPYSPNALFFSFSLWYTYTHTSHMHYQLTLAEPTTLGRETTPNIHVICGTKRERERERERKCERERESWHISLFFQSVRFCFYP